MEAFFLTELIQSEYSDRMELRRRSRFFYPKLLFPILRKMMKYVLKSQDEILNPQEDPNISSSNSTEKKVYKVQRSLNRNKPDHR